MLNLNVYIDGCAFGWVCILIFFFLLHIDNLLKFVEIKERFGLCSCNSFRFLYHFLSFPTSCLLYFAFFDFLTPHPFIYIFPQTMFHFDHLLLMQMYHIFLIETNILLVLMRLLKRSPRCSQIKAFICSFISYTSLKMFTCMEILEIVNNHKEIIN